MVLAHMMLYHTKSPDKALQEIKRVLKKSGVAGISVLSNTTGQEYLSLAHSLEPRIPPITAAAAFSEEIADNVLPRHFTGITKHLYENVYSWAEASPVVELLKTYITVAPLNLPAEFFCRYEEAVRKIIEKEGCFKSLFRLALYIGRK